MNSDTLLHHQTDAGELQMQLSGVPDDVEVHAGRMPTEFEKRLVPNERTGALVARLANCGR